MLLASIGDESPMCLPCVETRVPGKEGPVIADDLPNGQGAPLKEQNLSSLKQQMTLKYLHNAKFFIIHRTEGDTFSSVSPFLIQKGLSATVRSVKAVSKMRSSDLLVEVTTTKQAEQLLALQMLANIPITVLPHANLNSSRGVISESDLYNVPEQEILEGLQDQKVCAVRRITIRRDGQVVNTKHLILTFACPDLPQFITAGYLCCSVRPYIPNPLSGEGNGQEKCINCKDDHPLYSRSCNTWKLEKEIITVKIKSRLTYPEARLAVTNRTPIQGFSYAAVAKKNHYKLRSHIDDVKAIIHKYRPVCVALQETFLKSCHTAKIRRYGCVRKDTEGSSVSGGVCIFTSLDVPSSALSLRTSLQAVAVRIHSTSLYLPPNAVIRQQDLNDLVDQLPAPFVILGDFNGHSTLCGSVKTNPRGRQIEQVLSNHCLCLLNHEEPTYFHEPTRSFHTLDLAICSPSLLPILNFSVEKDLYNSDHFPVVLSHVYDASGKTFPPKYSYSRADWAFFTQLAVISDAMVKTESVDTAVQEITNVFIAAADLSIPKVSSHSFQRYKPWWNTDCQTAYKNQRKLWGILSRYPTTENLLAFKKAKANARRVRRQSQRQSWIRVWKERCFPSSWREAIAIPILKPGKVATDPLSYRPIALTSCFCTTFERMINTRLVYVLEKEKCISPLQSGFRKCRSTLDNLVFLESQIRDAFVKRNHLVSLFFDIEKAYDRTWRYGILRNMYRWVTK
ncbi:putative RNA-directed DNA polymerase from transposon X-element [Trichonephila clavipes]|uniref:Putative RNA-directed DNA polymerase from transposon X-element n=1 Tax=Trichonephila clavipes TaxID=2585209 RepID=A0A8X6W1F4_TRICX|nr:putative RNA-directed DNA polymerase from transposon X-element [Trichonephila clavipes]